MPEITVKLNIYTLPDGGEKIIPDESVIDEQIARVKAKLEDTEAEMEDVESDAEKAQLRSNKLFLKQTLRDYTRKKADLPALLAKCKPVTYKFTPTSYQDLIEMESAAKVDQDTFPRLDNSLLMQKVIPTLFSEPIEPTHAAKVFDRWKQEAYANELDLPFLG